MFYALITFVSDKVDFASYQKPFDTFDACGKQIEAITQHFIAQNPNVYVIGAACAPEHVLRVVQPFI